MPMKRRVEFLTALNISFFIIAAISLLFHLFIFEFRYTWFLHTEESMILDIIYGAGAISILFFWVVYPSRILVVLIAFISYLLPPIINSKAFVSIDIQLMVFVIPSLLLFLVATELRQRTISSKTRGHENT